MTPSKPVPKTSGVTTPNAKHKKNENSVQKHSLNHSDLKVSHVGTGPAASKKSTRTSSTSKIFYSPSLSITNLGSPNAWQ